MAMVRPKNETARRAEWDQAKAWAVEVQRDSAALIRKLNPNGSNPFRVPGGSYTIPLAEVQQLRATLDKIAPPSPLWYRRLFKR
jgi:hypothetical protein